MSKNSLAKSAVFLIIITALSKILGFAREMVLAYIYGTSAMSDVIIIGSSVSGILFTGITAALLTAYIPVASSLLEKGEKRVAQFSSNLMNIGTLLVLILSLIAVIFIKPIISLFAVGFEGTILESTITIAVITTISSCFVCVTHISSGYLQLNGRFGAVGIQSLLLNIIVIVTLVLTVNNSFLIGVGYSLATIIPAIVIFLYAIFRGLRYTLRVDLKDKELLTVLKMAVPIFIGQIAIQLNGMIDKSFASTLAEGTVSALRYANMLCLFATTLFVTTISTVIFPKISKYAATNDIKNIKKSTISSLSVITMIIIPITIISIILSNPIIKLLFERGAFDSQATKITSGVFAIYAVGLLGTAFSEILNKSFYALKDAKTPVLWYSLGVVVNIVLNALLINRFKQYGLATATSIASTLIMFFLLIALRRKIGAFGFFELSKNILKCGISSLIMAGAVILIKNILYGKLSAGFIGNLLSVVIPSLAGITIYIIMLYFLRVKELSILLNEFKNKIR